MNETIRTIKNRRSIRKFKSEQIDEKVLQVIIEAGLYAPSGHNQQPWNFAVVQNKEIIEELNVESKKIIKAFPDDKVQKMMNNEKFNIFYNAPTVIIISGKDNAMTPREDCGAATQNMLLAAESLNIGGCWIGFVTFLFRSQKGEEYKKKLNIPEGYSPYYAIALGYKDSNPRNALARKENTVQYIK